MISMVQTLYRFRSLNALLGPLEGHPNGFDELRRQTIYFSRPEDLNDPLEGFNDLFWSGDVIVWKNLFRHYLLCLELAFTTYLIAGHDIKLTRAHIGVERSLGDAPSDVRDMHKLICHAFFANPDVASYPRKLASRTVGVRRNELTGHLGAVHGYAVKCISEVFARNGLMPQLPSGAFEKGVSISEAVGLCDIYNDLEQEVEGQKKLDQMIAVQMHMASQMDLITRSRLADTSVLSDNKFFVFADFPVEFVRALESLIHADWYTASFAKNCSNSSLWGNYAINHEGMCLKFRVDSHETVPSLPLNLITCVSGGPQRELRNTYGIVSLPFYPVTYSDGPPAVDFFRSIGTLPIPVLNETWFCDEDGSRSECHDDMFTDEGAWRRRYWDRFDQSVTSKTADWAYEEEYRLLLRPMITDYSQPSDRCVKYRLDSLEGIVFGIKTPVAAKLAVMRIMGQKFNEVGHQTMTFSQAYFDHRSGRIETTELNLLKLEP